MGYIKTREVSVRRFMIEYCIWMSLVVVWTFLMVSFTPFGLPYEWIMWFFVGLILVNKFPILMMECTGIRCHLSVRKVRKNKLIVEDSQGKKYLVNKSDISEGKYKDIPIYGLYENW